MTGCLPPSEGECRPCLGTGLNSSGADCHRCNGTGFIRPTPEANAEAVAGIALEAVKALIRERDEAIAGRDSIHKTERAVRGALDEAETEVARLREGLQRIAESSSYPGHTSDLVACISLMQNVARALLSKLEEKL